MVVQDIEGGQIPTSDWSQRLADEKSVTEIVKVQTILERGVENILENNSCARRLPRLFVSQQDRLILFLSHRQSKVVIGYEQWSVSDQRSFT